MVSTELRKFLKAQPFQPFVVLLADGRELEVRHPETVAIGETRRIAAIYDLDEEGFESVDLLLVTSLERVGRKGSRGKRAK